MKKYYDIEIEGHKSSGAKVVQMTPPTGNAIFTIFPYKKNNQWMFDDEARGVLMEPFVAGADDLIEILAEGKLETTILFSPNEFKGAQFHVEKVGGDEFGTDYHSPSHGMDLWLCPALFKYLNPAPEKIYIQVKN